MSYLLRDKEPNTFQKAFMTAIEIDNNIKYGLTKSHFSRNVSWQDEVQRKNQCHKECLIIDHHRGNISVVNNFVEN